MPKKDLRKLLDYLEDEAGLLCFQLQVPVCSCNDREFNSIPDLVFSIEGTKYFMPRESYLIRNEYGQCIVGIMTHPTIQFWILGLNFFSNYYTVFDQEEMRIGFAISRYAHPRVLEFHQNSNLFD